MTATRILRPARALCRSGWHCTEPVTLRATSPHIDTPLDRCAYHLGESVTAALWALADAGHPAKVTVTAITNGS